MELGDVKSDLVSNWNLVMEALRIWQFIVTTSSVFTLTFSLVVHHEKRYMPMRCPET